MTEKNFWPSSNQLCLW